MNYLFMLIDGGYIPTIYWLRYGHSMWEHWSTSNLNFYKFRESAMKDVDFFFKKETVASALKWYIRYISVWKLQFLNNVICQNEGQSPKA